MKDEIKEILDLLNYNKEAILNRVCCIEDFISREQTIKLLDYITNLQEENERLKEWKEDLLNENIELENIRKEAIEYINQ